MAALLTRKLVITYVVVAIAGLILIKVKHGNLEEIMLGVIAGLAIGFDLARRFFGQKVAELRSAHEYQLFAANQGDVAQAHPRELTAGPSPQYTGYPSPQPYPGDDQYGRYPAGQQYPGQPAQHWPYGAQAGQVPPEGYGDPTRGY